MHAYFEKKPNNQVFAQKVTDLNGALHLHPAMEMFMVLSGETVVTVREQTQVLRPGELAVMFPNAVHSYVTLDSNAEAILVHWDLTYTGGYLDLLLSQHPVDPFLRPEQIHPNITYAFQEMMREQQIRKESPAYAPFIQLILSRLLPVLELQDNKTNDHPELTFQIASCISQSFREPLTLDQLAQRLGMSKYRLSHLFSQKMGQNFQSYLSSVRLSYACRLLTGTNLPITEVAGRSGFESEATFFRAFKNQLGITPLKYRKRMGADPYTQEHIENADPARVLVYNLDDEI